MLRPTILLIILGCYIFFGPAMADALMSVDPGLLYKSLGGSVMVVLMLPLIDRLLD